MDYLSIPQRIKNRQAKLSVVGLGYVGLPLALAFARVAEVVGFDLDAAKIDCYHSGVDATREVGDTAVAEARMLFTADEYDLSDIDFFIIAVPTPVDQYHQPDFGPLLSASEIVGRHLHPGAIVAYESTVYPGATEEICLPVLESSSGLCAGKDFKLGYSPERINPGDRLHTVERITKLVAGMDAETLAVMADVYTLVIEAGVHQCPSIMVAEAAKIMENVQRDVNIAFMNEMALVFGRCGLEMRDVLEAARTRWNFADFRPGLVGGHCTGVDPYYLMHKAEERGHRPEIMSACRNLNERMAGYVTEAAMTALGKSDVELPEAKVLILGITFKENVSDIRNSKAADIALALKKSGVGVMVVDPRADPDEVKRRYGLELMDLASVKMVDAVILAVMHQEFLSLGLPDLASKFHARSRVLIDVKGVYDKLQAKALKIHYWSL